MKILVYGAGVLGTLYAARLHEAGHDVALLARGRRLAALREHGVLIAEGDNPAVRRVPVPIVDKPSNGYDLITVFVRTHQVDAVLESLAAVDGDVLFLLNWAAGAEPLAAILGPERVLLGFPNAGGTMDGDVVRYRATSLLNRLVPMTIGGTHPRSERIMQAFRTAGIRARAEPHMDAWLTTHAAFEIPLSRAAHAAGGPTALAADPEAVRIMLHQIRENLSTLPTPPVPRAFTALKALPEALLVPLLRSFLRSRTAVQSGLSDTTATATAEHNRLTNQLQSRAKR
ncbi:2-dehydropantoate 2-reductase N-terminal domain-containing protein [Actinoplanes sp. NPDC048967]|uniref:ketopantoate reductase family protein n=1 Tax=Actinoplanes sp. NPDC048967 TaxID=3155269 RepID=UPI0033C9BEDF